MNLNINKLLYLYLMITCNLCGGLGNQLFQIFTTISYAIKSKKKFYFLDSEISPSITKRYTFWNSLLYKLKPFLIKEIVKDSKNIKQKDFTFNEIEISELINNICLQGYFQSYKYFQNHYETIFKMIDIEKQKNTVSKSHGDFYLKNTVSMHFRLGDYKLLPNVYPILTYEYYEKAFEYIQKHNLYYLNILFFCEDEDLDEVNIIVEKLKNRFNHNCICRAPNTLKDWEQILLMSCCNYNIIANSSFSWWGAYFNTNYDKIVCYPETWFVNNTDTKDLCPLEWIKII